MGLQPPWEQSTGRYDIYAVLIYAAAQREPESFCCFTKEALVLPACVHYLIKPLQFNLA